MTQLDYSAFTRKISFRERMYGVEAWLVGMGFVATVGLLLYGTGMAMATGSANMLIACGIWAIVFALLTVVGYIKIKTRVRIKYFAEDNGMQYTIDKSYDGRSGIIFGTGYAKQFRQLFETSGHDFTELGNYEFTTGSGKNSQTHDFGFLHIKLPRRLPNMVLDSRKNNLFGKLSNLPVGFSKDQRLSLEGDFDNYFTLYAPAQYKTDALYVFTPDVMQALITAAHAYDCEVIDDDFYIYSSSKFDFADVQQLQELTVIAAALRPELIAQTDYYADARVGNRALNSIAPAGSRLKTRVSFWTIVGIALLVLYYVGMVVSGLI